MRDKMATREMQLISRIIRTGCLTDALEWGITPEDFLTNEGRAMYLHILGYYSRADTSGSVLGVEAARYTYPNFVLCDDPSMQLDALCMEARKMRQTLELKAHLSRALEVAEMDPMRAAAEMQKASADTLALGTGRSRDVRFTAGLDQILTKYEMKKQGIDMSCAKWPWDIMNEVTGGIEKDDYIVFYGRPKSMKSWILAYLISWFFYLDKRVLIYTKEMSWENIFMRVGACIAMIEYQGLRLGKLSPEHEQALYTLRRFINMAKDNEKLICLQGNEEGTGSDTVPWLQSKIDTHKPDFIAIDGMYLMSDVKNAKKDNERVRNISRDLRQMNLRTGVPIFATLQANRAAAKNEEANLDEVAFSDAIGQDATGIFRVINEKTGPTVALVVGGAREYALNGFRINAIPAVDFSYHGALSSKDIEKAKEADVKEEDDPKAHATKRKAATTESKAVANISKRIEKNI